MGLAAGDAIFMHCLPAHRGEEVTNSVLDGARSRVWPEAANRFNAGQYSVTFMRRIEWLVGQANLPGIGNR